MSTAQAPSPLNSVMKRDAQNVTSSRIERDRQRRAALAALELLRQHGSGDGGDDGQPGDQRDAARPHRHTIEPDSHRLGEASDQGLGRRCVDRRAHGCAAFLLAASCCSSRMSPTESSGYAL